MQRCKAIHVQPCIFRSRAVAFGHARAASSSNCRTSLRTSTSLPFPCHRQRCAAVFVHRIPFRVGSEKHVYNSSMTTARCKHQRRPAVFVAQVHLSTEPAKALPQLQPAHGRAAYLDQTQGLQVCKWYLLWGLKSINRTYFGLFGALGKKPI